jgi:hypothetical protein
MPLQIQFGIEVVEREKIQPWIRQVHGAHIVEAGETPPVTPVEADGVFTFGRSRISVLTADCLPILLWDTEDPHLPKMALHCGWRGALAGIAQNGLAYFPRKKTIRVVFGPAIGVCCFEVRQDFFDAFSQQGKPTQDFSERRGERRFFNLIRFVRETDLRELEDSQFDSRWIECTHCSPKKFPSFRRDGRTTISLRTWIQNGSTEAPTHPTHPDSTVPGGATW